MSSKERISCRTNETKLKINLLEIKIANFSNRENAINQLQLLTMRYMSFVWPY